MHYLVCLLHSVFFSDSFRLRNVFGSFSELLVEQYDVQGNIRYYLETPNSKSQEYTNFKIIAEHKEIIKGNCKVAVGVFL